MESNLNLSILLYVVVISTAAWFSLKIVYAPRHDPNEPPLVHHPLPYVGHVLGLLRHGTRYLEMTSADCKLPIYTLNMLSGKTYVVTSPDLVNAVNRNSKTIAFNPFIAMLGKRITDHDEATSRIVQHNLNGEHGTGYVINVHNEIVTSLAPGKNLIQTTASMLQHASPYFKALGIEGEVNLFDWIRNMVTMCSTRALYGPKNPYSENPHFVTAFWEFENGLNYLMANIAPSILAQKAYRARADLSLAFQHYFEDYDPSQAHSSQMIQARYLAATKYGVTPSNQGRLEVGTQIGILANTIPSIFYTLVHIYSDPQLTSKIRAELEIAGFKGTPEKLAENPDILTMPEKCPLLNSTWQEVLRIHALGASARFVLEDVMLDEKYLLKKGMVVQMPMAVMHADTAAWGRDAAEFQPRRFLKQRKLASYRPFGGGASMCPGRHFVTMETLSLTACMLSRFDIVPIDGKWIIPSQRQKSLATNVFPPSKDVRVKIIARQAL